MVLSLLGLLAALGRDLSDGGMTLKTYENMALAGPPATTSVVSSTAIAVPGGAPLSAELSGTVAFPPTGGVYSFKCDWTGSTMGFVWVDGHMICDDGHAYKVGAGQSDNPLPVNTLNRSKGIVTSLPFRAHFYHNGAPAPAPGPAPGPPVSPSSCTAKSIGQYDDTGHQCGFKRFRQSLNDNSWRQAAAICAQSGYTIAGAQASKGQEVWCGDTLPHECKPVTGKSVSPCPGNKSETCGGDFVLEVIQFSCDKPPAPPPAPPPPVGIVGVRISWAPITTRDYDELLVTARDTHAMAMQSISRGNGDGVGTTVASFEEVAERLLSELPHAQIPAAALGPELPAAEKKRDVLQRSLATGWGPWLHQNMLPIVKLPEAAVITPAVCSKSTGKCMDTAVPDGARPHPRNKPGTETRVGHHAFDRSYVQFYFGGGATPGGACNISLEYSVSGVRNGDIDILVTPQGDCGGNCSDWEIQLGARHAWFKVGNATAEEGGVTVSSAGLPDFTVYTTGAASTPGAVPGSPVALSIDLVHGSPVGLSTTKGATVATISAKLAAARTTEEDLLVKTFGADRATQGQAIKASAMWTLISTPAENGGAPLLPVSRVWNFAPGPANDDFTYAIFDWDNLFATLLAATGAPSTAEAADTGSSPYGGFEFAVSNLFQVVKSKTAAGFVPNFAAGGMRSQDRTEPPIGAKVTLNLVDKFGANRMGWVVDALFDDLLDWNDWFIRKRLKPPLNMVALGTFNDQNHQAGNMQDARYESGLDNSPMYDGTFVNTTDGCSLYESGCGLMQLYDVGMTSMWVQEAFALAKLAVVAGRPQSLADMLNARGKAMAQKISDNLWNEDLGIFVNRFSADHNNGSFYEHVSPTSFYALQAHAATDDQAARMAENWMLNSSRFCVSPNGDYSGNRDTCYWGLPSIEASDPAYPPLGYWRGYIWGPMAQLTFWSLQEYDHVPQIRTARKAMCKQMAGLMMSQWNENRHICENYNPHKTADTTGGDCSGTRFYHWGALTGLIGMMEDGLF